MSTPAEQDVARIRRVARALQAMRVAMNVTPPDLSKHGSVGEVFELYYAEQELAFAAAMSFTDDQAIPPSGFDPANRGGWAWWAKRILDSAEGEV